MAFEDRNRKTRVVPLLNLDCSHASANHAFTATCALIRLVAAASVGDVWTPTQH